MIFFRAFAPCIIEQTQKSAEVSILNGMLFLHAYGIETDTPYI